MSTGIRNNYICTQSIIGGTTEDAVPGFPTSVTVPKNGRALIRIAAKVTTTVTGLLFNFTETSGTVDFGVVTFVYDTTAKTKGTTSLADGDATAVLTNSAVLIEVSVFSTTGAVLPIKIGPAAGGTMTLSGGASCEVTIF